MFYVLSGFDGDVAESFDNVEDAVAYADRLCEEGEDAWVVSDEDDEDPAYEDYDFDDECGFNPYMGCYDFDC